ncbi:hypothetical protein S40285_06037 [Stachybotrys chlorohalonatus IBT 40285]|uniref:Uncharacterized protein n=1 Tax=Stachybotrys chlorohalonatus (strain IBT 40285) TaxID=1283841 RepID=A0A084Q8S0_STAC4|nr:hypothetical protein S40285_06037 [Stachybotrys chlorohalonata IBT 40285]
MQGHASIVKILLDELDDLEAVLESYGGTWLAYAAAGGHEDLLWLLLGQGVNPNARATKLPITRRKLRSDRLDIEFLFWHEQYRKPTPGESSPKKRGQLPLTCAAWTGRVESVRLLLATGNVDITLTDELNRTAFMYAADRGHEPVVELLLGVYNIDLELQDTDRRKAIYISCSRRRESYHLQPAARQRRDVGSTTGGLAARLGHSPSLSPGLADQYR